MAASTFARCCALTLRHEGGWSDHPADPGGATNLGVTIGTLSSWLGRRATKDEVRALTKESVALVYRKNYRDAIRGDELPAGPDYCAYDFAVNSGPKRGAVALQRPLGVADDGVIGSVTPSALATVPVETLIRAIFNDRMAFLQRLSTWSTFGKGWSARVNSVLAEALATARLAPVPTPPVKVEPPPAPSPVAIAIDSIDPKAAPRVAQPN
ncbi:glycoside hydrolase family 108 protein [Methylobacterium haplocladii]|uniref:TtsA-like Glycoside hydrolase family 108 domain-containing protein n=1 Tax=Methylobacterium haplocladii TaxID=1176176 RepID=A0A512IVV9_9HYPH|nr:glycosyl hydrolase 108 family protein [Methylobacterium haplocladii]GEP01857.1 hypothetical protein MHA02_42440 [Methylobacterium haplocladii]GJD86454.1 hypothetical protein HPGCJGGD_4361 [Methylobacterium haplocladii]GLS61534.1 hypothetical protein GCM10007887_42550 [Methylobacterium haplocladii]